MDLHNGDVSTANFDWEDFRNSFDKVFTVRSERIVGQAEFAMNDATFESGVIEPLAGAQFDLYRQKGSASDGNLDELVNADKRFTNDADGKATTETTLIDNVLTGEVMKHGLTPGTYYFKQVATLADFVYDAARPVTTDAFTVGKDGNRFTWRSDGTFGDFVEAAGAAMLANEPLYAAVRVHVVDAENGADLVGATFELRQG